MEGTRASALGVRAEGEHTLVLELEHPRRIARVARAQHHLSGAAPVEASAYARQLRLNGPYVLAERVANDHIRSKNPRSTTL